MVSIFQKALKVKSLEDFEVRKTITLSHLQFSNDTIFFGSSKRDPFLILNHILAFFEAMLRLKINRDKHLIRV